MKRAFVGSALCAASGLLGSCTVPLENDIPVSASFGPEYASVTVIKGHTSTFFNSNDHWVTKSYGDTCSPQFAVEEDGLLETGKLTTFQAINVNNSGGNGSTCVNIFAFTPQPHGRYSIKQSRHNASVCNVEVLDLETGEAPSGFEELPKWHCIVTRETPDNAPPEEASPEL